MLAEGRGGGTGRDPRAYQVSAGQCWPLDAGAHGIADEKEFLVDADDVCIGSHGCECLENFLGFKARVCGCGVQAEESGGPAPECEVSHRLDVAVPGCAAYGCRRFAAEDGEGAEGGEFVTGEGKMDGEVVQLVPGAVPFHVDGGLVGDVPVGNRVVSLLRSVIEG